MIAGAEARNAGAAPFAFAGARAVEVAHERPGAGPFEVLDEPHATAAGQREEMPHRRAANPFRDATGDRLRFCGRRGVS